jgi:hypothetical protein
MADLDTSLSDQELIAEVRDALGHLDKTKVPDDTIEQTFKRFVIPLLNDRLPKEPNIDKKDFDNAVIAWTAEKSFMAWLSFTRVRDREVETYLDPEQYLSQLRERTDLSLQIIDVTRPPQTPNEVVTIKHDGKKRKVNLQKPWVLPE